MASGSLQVLLFYPLLEPFLWYIKQKVCISGIIEHESWITSLSNEAFWSFLVVFTLTSVIPQLWNDEHLYHRDFDLIIV